MVPSSPSPLMLPIIYFIIISIIIILYFTKTITLISTTFVSSIMMIITMLLFMISNNSNITSVNIYKNFLISLIGIISLFSVLFSIYPKSMNDGFGYSISLTFILSAITFFTLWYKGEDTKKGSYLAGGVSMILLFIFLILWTCDISKLPSTNYPLMVNYFLILSIIGLAIMMIRSENGNDTLPMNQMNIAEQLFNKTRNKYLAMFVMFVIIVIGLYLFNPFSIMTNYATSSTFVILSIGMLLAIMALVYHHFFANPNNIPSFNKSPGLGTFLNGIYVILALFISWWILTFLVSLLGVFDVSTYTSGQGWGQLIVNMMLLSVMIAILYRLFNVGGYLKNSPIYSLIINTILYIPCIFVGIINNMSVGVGTNVSANATDKINILSNKSELAFLLLGIVIIPAYFLMTNYAGPFIESKFYKQGGKQLINLPVPLDVLTNVDTYQSLNDSESFNYQYALSFWFYIDSFSPSVSSAYSKINDILSYGTNPSIKYDGQTNSIIISVKQNIDKSISVIDLSNKIDGNLNTSDKSVVSNVINTIKESHINGEVDNDGNRLIYTRPNILLQKWNNIVINSNGGTMDIFYNGELVKSAIEVVPYMTYDMLSVGTENGIKGNIANLMYFKQPLDILTITRLYNSFKNKDPPSISSNNDTLVKRM